jgi:hypothetical protein
MTRQLNTLLALAAVLFCLCGTASLAGTEDIELTVANGPQPGEVTLTWNGGQPPFVLYASQDLGSLTEAANVLGETSGYSWVDMPPAMGITYYHVAEMPPPTGETLVRSWSSSHGTAGASVWPNDVAVDPDDNILMSGEYDGSVNFGDGSLVNGTNNVFLAKFNADGSQTLWSVGFDDGQSGSTLISSGATSDSAGNSYLTGYFRYQTSFGGTSLTPTSGFDMFLVKVSPTGSVLWAKKYGGGGNQYAKAIAANASDEILVAGKFAGAANFGGSNLASNGGDEIFLAKFDTDGNHIWSTSYGSSNSDEVLDLAVEGDELAITGFYKAAGADFGGAPLAFLGFEDIYVAKYRDTGSSLVHLFSRGFGSTSGDKGYGVAIDPISGDVAVTGTFDSDINFGGPTTYPDTGGGVDIFLVKLDSNGNWIGDQAFGGSHTYSIISRDVLIDPTGAVVITGDTSISVDFGGGVFPGSGQDMFIAKFDANVAQHIWSARYGTLGGDSGRAMTLSHADEIVVCGEYWTSISFDGTTAHTSAGTPDGFIASFTTAP